MKELKCPHCGQVFKVDEADYASILSQVKNSEFEAEISRRLKELEEKHKAEQDLAAAKNEKSFQAQLSKKDLEISAKQAEIERLRIETESQLDIVKREKDAEIELLKGRLESIESLKKGELEVALSEKDKKIALLNAEIEKSDAKIQIAVMEERTKAQKTVQEKETQITQLRTAADIKEKEVKLHEAELAKRHEEDLRLKQEQIDYYKDLKTRMSTKMVGETLEQHCSIEFETYIRPMMPNAYFDKDNDTLEGTKGDFIFRDSEDGAEYISIMFEMKNEADATEKKHKNEDFFKELDKDRREKKCEYAVLVTLLEADNDYYNQGIVDVSHRYPKMYVIRPQFFVPLISLLRNAARNSLEYRKQLAEMKNQNIDIENFEAGIDEFKRLWGMHYTNAQKRFDEAIDEIDKTIQHLQKVRDALVTSGNHLGKANSQAADLTIKRLTKGNPTMAQKFAELKEK